MALRQGGACQQQAQPQRVGCRWSRSKSQRALAQCSSALRKRLRRRSRSTIWSERKTLSSDADGAQALHRPAGLEPRARLKRRTGRSMVIRRLFAVTKNRGDAHFLWATGVCTGKYGGRWLAVGQDLATAVPQLKSVRAATQGDSVTATLRYVCAASLIRQPADRPASAHRFRLLVRQS